MSMECRPILLHNEFLPAISGPRQWDYQVLGYYDGITVLENTVIECTGRLKNLFDICAEYEGEERPYLTQFLFGFHSGSKNEEQFWKNKYPFTYLCLMQFDHRYIKDYKNYLDDAKYIKDEVESLQLQADERFVTQSYYTLDNTDLLLIIKCQKSDTGARLINNLHEDIGRKHPFRVLNTYSILALKKDDINKKINPFDEKDKIDLLEIRLVESRPGSVAGLFDMLYQEIKQEVEAERNLDGEELEKETDRRISRKALLGAEDEAIMIKEMPWNRLVNYYKDKNGVFCNSNECVRIYANAVSCKIMIPLKEKIKTVVKEDSSDVTKVKAKLCTNLYKMIELNYKYKKDERSQAEKKTLMMIVNALSRFEYSYYSGNRAFSDYSFYQMYWPFYLFVQLLNNSKMDLQLYNESYFSFIKAMILRTQNFSKPDRVYTQITDFNIRYFDIPSKLVAIYSAFVYYLKKVLNKGEKRYEFLICPGFNSKVSVKEVFERTNENERYRLFMLEIPEQQLYDPKTMMVILGHEIAHFVGTDTRNRILRKDIILDISVRLILVGMRGYLEKHKVFQIKMTEKEICDGLDKEMNQMIRLYMDRYKDRDFFSDKYPDKGDAVIENNCRFIEKYSDYSEVLMKYLFSSIEELLNCQGVNIFSFLIKKDFEEGLKKGKLKYEDRDRFYSEKQKELRTCIQSLLGNSKEENSMFTIQNEIEYIVYFLKECYADLICILLLELSVKEYLSAFERSLSDRGQEVKELLNTEVLTRITLVIAAMGADQTDVRLQMSGIHMFHWKNEQFSDKNNWDSQMQELNDYIHMFSHVYLEKEMKMDPAAFIESDRNVIYDNKILRKIVTYLKKCKRDFYMNVQKAEYENMKLCYRLADMNDAEMFFGEMSDMIKKYEADIYEDIQEERAL